MICPKCHGEIADDSRFCKECGSSVSTDSRESGVEGGVSLGEARTLDGAAGDPDMSLGDLATEVGRAEESDTSADGLKGTPLADRYELLEEIGRGGFAVVHRARDRKLDRIVAVKRLLPEKLSDSQSRQTIERFAREARVIASLNHRNIVQVFDHDQDDEGHYIVMELVDGGSLRKYLREHGKLPLADAVRLLRGVCQGLSTAHRRDLVHRDIKPANILLKHEGEELLTKIVDFGLARAGRDSDTSKTGYGLGTPFYMPPEQRRDAKNVNHTADIYAVGKMLYEMVTGEVPDNVDPQSIPPDPGLASIIFRCIKNCREERYFSVAELIADLDEVAGGISPAKMQRASAGAANQCPNCGAANPEDVKFCEDCGNGLTRLCPECERENSIHKTFCGECGTDLGGFLQAQEALQRMQTHAGEKRWSRVTKEFCLLHVPMRLLGKKGKQLWTEINEQNAEAKSKLEQRDELKHRIHRAIEEGDYEQALHLTTRCQEVDPHQTEVNELPEILHEKMDDRSYRRVRDTASGAVAVGDVDGARRAMSSYLEQYPTGRHATEAAKILSEELAPLSALGGLRLRMEAYEFDVALAAISEIERKGAAQKDSQAAILGTGPSPYEILNEAREARNGITQAAQHFDGLVGKAGVAESEGRWIESARLLSEANQVYPGRGDVQEKLLEIQARIEAAKGAFALFSARVTELSGLFRTRHLTACKVLATELSRELRPWDCLDDVRWQRESRLPQQKLRRLGRLLEPAGNQFGLRMVELRAALNARDRLWLRACCQSIASWAAEPTRWARLFAAGQKLCRLGGSTMGNRRRNLMRLRSYLCRWRDQLSSDLAGRRRLPTKMVSSLHGIRKEATMHCVGQARRATSATVLRSSILSRTLARLAIDGRRSIGRMLLADRGRAGAGSRPWHGKTGASSASPKSRRGTTSV